MKIKRFQLNFFRKLLLYSISTTLIGIMMVFLLNRMFLDKFYIYRKTMELPMIAREIKELKNNPEKLQAYIENESYENGVMITLGNMNHMMRSRENAAPISPRYAAYERGRRSKEVELKYTKFGRRYLAYKDDIDGIPLYITLPLVSMESYKYETWLIGLMSMAVALLACIVMGRYFSKRLTKNLEVLNDAAKKMAHLEFVEKLNIHTGDEVGELADSVLEMSLNLKEAMESLKNFVSNASHELKTPISIINLTSQNLLSGEIKEEKERRKAYAVLVKETKEMNELISNLMVLSKINYMKHRLMLENINLQKILKDSLEKYEFLELKNDLEIKMNIPQDYKTKIDYGMFKLAMDNIIQNSLKYSPYEGQVEIYIVDDALYIENRLTEDLEENCEELFNPFSRGSNAAGGEIEGSGLGLSIVKSILELLELPYSIVLLNGKFIFKIGLRKQ